MSSFVKASGNITPYADTGEEFPFLHTITVVDRVVSVDKPELVQNNIKTETVTLNLDSEWDGLSTVINIGNEKPVSVIWSGEPVIIPSELMTTVGSLDVSVVGYGDDGGIRAVTKKATSIFNVVASGFVEGDEPVHDPTTIIGQLVTAGDKANQAANNANDAADRADAAAEAAGGFGLQVGTTTTGEPGTDAVVEIEKTGTKYTANFTIPRGEAGPSGVNENVPLGSTSGVVAHATDAYPALPRKVKVHGATSGGNSVEPTKLIFANKNLVPADKVSIFNRNNYIQAEDFYIPIGIGLNVTFSRYVGDAAIIMEDGTRYGITSIKHAFTVTHGTGKVKQLYCFVSRDGDANLDTDFIQITVGDDTEYSPGVVTEINLPTGISLADGDTLTINRDGTTQIVHAEGEPTVLENVTLPELPAPTFNVYTDGGYVQPTVDVGYEQDVNLVLQALKAKNRIA